MQIPQKVVRAILARQMRDDPAFAQKIQESGRWTDQRLQDMSLEAIIAQLRAWGIPFEGEQFTADLRRLGSAEQLAEEWWQRYQLQLQGFDADFPFLAALALHQQLCPDIVTAETLDDWMQEGYSLLEQDQTCAACEVWLRVWEHLKQALPTGAQTVAAADRLIDGQQFVSNWCQDLKMELGNAGLDDPAFDEKRLAYCREFRTIFGGQEDLIPGFLRAEAEALFALGRVKEGEECYQGLITRFPHQAWGYIGWADAYWLFRVQHVAKDYGKAEAIYLRALAQRGLDEPDAVHVRLADLYGEWGKTTAAQRHQRYAKRHRSRPADPAPAKHGKIGRNEPCPCGSSKKYKRCCGHAN